MGLKSENQGYLFILPAIIFLMFVAIYPLITVTKLSFFRNYLPEKVTYFIGLDNYKQIFQDNLFWLCLRNTLFFTGASVGLHLLLGLSLALLLNQKFSKTNNVRNFFRGIFIAPWLFSTAAAAALWTLMYHPFGIFTGILMRLHLIKAPIALLGNPSTALPSLILTNVWKSYPFFMVMLLAGLQAIPEELYDASKMDGAGKIQIFLYITIPQLKNIIITIAILDVIWTFAHFDLVYIMTGGGPFYTTELITTYAYRTAFELLRFGYASALGMVLFFVLLIACFFYANLYVKGKIKLL